MNKKQRIAVISYDYPTRKTQEVLLRLKGKGYSQVDVYALPFVYRKPLQPLVVHRPAELLLALDNEELSHHLQYRYIRATLESMASAFYSESYEAILIAGAGLLPENIVTDFRIINSHPGYLPYVRGLDAVKWAVYEKLPLGVTVHWVNKEADAGFLIIQQKLELSLQDTFHTMCFRLWNMEMQLLVDSVEIIPTLTEPVALSTDFGESHRRMPKEKEQELYTRFEEYKKIFAKGESL
ncbi:formyltransferase family protein [Apibacter raozihei]|uniref:formyltransferase family protein n=1 Tax=Apibacter raozihei TaxID=2500547 RepID=UPI000FE3AA07|nr:formyltransferase family protein [Apibacter raozihei]